MCVRQVSTQSYFGAADVEDAGVVAELVVVAEAAHRLLPEARVAVVWPEFARLSLPFVGREHNTRVANDTMPDDRHPFNRLVVQQGGDPWAIPNSRSGTTGYRSVRDCSRCNVTHTEKYLQQVAPDSLVP